MAARPVHEQKTSEATVEEVQRQISAGMRALQLYLDDRVAQGHTTAERVAAPMEQAHGHGAEILGLTTLATATRPDETERQTPNSSPTAASQTDRAVVAHRGGLWRATNRCQRQWPTCRASPFGRPPQRGQPRPVAVIRRSRWSRRRRKAAAPDIENLYSLE